MFVCVCVWHCRYRQGGKTYILQVHPYIYTYRYICINVYMNTYIYICLYVYGNIGIDKGARPRPPDPLSDMYVYTNIAMCLYICCWTYKYIAFMYSFIYECIHVYMNTNVRYGYVCQCRSPSILKKLFEFLFYVWIHTRGMFMYVRVDAHLCVVIDMCFDLHVSMSIEPPDRDVELSRFICMHHVCIHTYTYGHVWNMCINTYMHLYRQRMIQYTYIHIIYTYIHTDLQINIHTYIHTYVHAHIHRYIHALYIHACDIHACINDFTQVYSILCIDDKHVWYKHVWYKHVCISVCIYLSRTCIHIHTCIAHIQTSDTCVYIYIYIYINLCIYDTIITGWRCHFLQIQRDHPQEDSYGRQNL